ncbi:thioesterase [Paenibacillus sp. GSMTC-2017]|uniref:thioesterase II family protein n=1 Tax=Paenibacillus sp. GSMTC-2017 TaxID=2794350 RepID=UPI0018D98BAA|nr:thioesterase domain-containing protein [Paenibacillus sp. GSMTC-2017]MBH5320085.1 thioesterase [Paenibacillus sp. GSMTC-2017]
MKVLCFPYAGSHINVFAELQKHLKKIDEEIEVISVEYAGHGRRFSEKPYDLLHDNVSDLYQQLSGQLNTTEEIIFIGYSMGSIIAYELAKLFESEGYNITKLMFMAATPPHRIEVVHENIESDEDLLRYCKVYGLISEDQFQSPQMRRLFLPALRSDIKSIQTYNLFNHFHCHSFDPSIQVAIFQGSEDRSVSEIDHWDELSSGEISKYNYAAAHFFLFECQQEVITDITTFILNKKQSLI